MSEELPEKVWVGILQRSGERTWAGPEDGVPSGVWFSYTRDDVATRNTRALPKVKPLEWQREPGGSYVWPLGMHYYTEEYDGRWSTSAMICNEDFWNGGHYPTRYQAEIAMQHHFNEQVADSNTDTFPDISIG